MKTTSIRWALSLSAGLALAGCATDPATLDTDLAAADPNALTWVAPSTTAVELNDAVTLVVSTRNTAARQVRFTVDGSEVGVCSLDDPEQDCHVSSLFRWTTMATELGFHHVVVSFQNADGTTVSAERDIEVVAQGQLQNQNLPSDGDDDPLMAPMDETSIDPMGQIVSNATVHAGFHDPNRGFHSIFGGIQWRVEHQRVILRNGAPIGSVDRVAQCMSRYGSAIRRFADRYRISRATVVATAITESNCTNPRGSSDGLSSGPMQVTASTCAAVTGLSSRTCRTRMHSDPAFSFEVGVRYMASSYQRNQHRNDPPKIAAAYNAGSLRRSYSNRWHLVSTGNHIDRFVSAYNAYHRWEANQQSRFEFLRVTRDFEGAVVTNPTLLPTNAQEGDTYFVGDLSERNGYFYEYVNGNWVSGEPEVSTSNE